MILYLSDVCLHAYTVYSVLIRYIVYTRHAFILKRLRMHVYALIMKYYYW